jgi:hypothetical protein
MFRKAQSGKKVRLNVDSVSYWIATNNARDDLLKREALASTASPRAFATYIPLTPFNRAAKEIQWRA